MEDIYEKLNFYLNEICKYLEKNHPFFFRNIYKISIFNDILLKKLEQYNFAKTTKQNKLTYQDVIAMAREIIALIDSSYLEEFDELVSNGVLDFSYDDYYFDSHVSTTYDGEGNVKRKLININRSFNYDDVRVLVHEFVHYTNDKIRSINRIEMAEFLSIYFEFFAVTHMLKSGINGDELDHFIRFKNVRNMSSRLFRYEWSLLAYIKFGGIDSDSCDYLYKYFGVKISEEDFASECRMLCDNLSKAEKNTEEIWKENYQKFGEALCEEFIGVDYLYILGTALALYARKYCSFDEIVYLNNHINGYDDMDIEDICQKIGIDLSDSEFMDKCILAMDEYIAELSQDKKMA